MVPAGGPMSDIITAIVSILKAAPAVADLCADRVYGDELPQAEALAMPRSALVVRASGGVAFQPGSGLNAQAQRVDLVAYGASPFEADLLRRGGYRCLTGVVRLHQGDVLIHSVQSAGGSLTGRDRDGNWPYAFQSFQALFSSEEVD